ncbi:hypothetical protein BC567DRAFT_224693 [Phyllosticta citribraziliensis]
MRRDMVVPALLCLRSATTTATKKTGARLQDQGLQLSQWARLCRDQQPLRLPLLLSPLPRGEDLPVKFVLVMRLRRPSPAAIPLLPLQIQSKQKTRPHLRYPNRNRSLTKPVKTMMRWTLTMKISLVRAKLPMSVKRPV